VQQLSDAFRKGYITTEDIQRRYDQRAMAEDTAATEGAKLQTRQAKSITPEMIELRAQAEAGGLEGQIAQQALQKETRAGRDQIFKMQVAQSLQEMQDGLPAETLRTLEMEYPNIVKPTRDSNGRVLNVDEVKAQLGHVVRTQKMMDQAADMSKQFETQTVQTAGGQEGVQTFWKGTSEPVPPNLVEWVNQARTANLFGGAQPGGFAPPPTGAPAVGVPAVPGAPVPAAPAGQPLAKGAPDPAGVPSTGMPVYDPGAVTPEGVFITKSRGGGKLTEVEGKALKFYRRMKHAEGFYDNMIANGFDPTEMKVQAQKDIWSMASKVPLLGTIAGRYVVGDDAKSFQTAVAGYTSAMLRDESGAAIRDDERAEYERMMFPMTDEPPDVVATKKERRRIATQALEQLSSGRIDNEEYEQIIEGTTGKAFPAATSSRSKERLGEGTNADPVPADIPIIKPGDPIPTSGWFKIEGETQPRRALGTTSSLPVPSQPTGAQQVFINPRFDNKTATSQSGIRG
jgi:hypothetical protein